MLLIPYLSFADRERIFFLISFISATSGFFDTNLNKLDFFSFIGKYLDGFFFKFEYRLKKFFISSGYKIGYKLLNAADYGVPQTRRRVFIVGELEGKNKNINQQKIILANEATSMLHGKSATVKAEQTAKNTFEKKSVGTDLPTLVLKKEQVINGINIIDIVTAANLSNSKSEVRRMIKNKGIKVNNKTIESDKFSISLNNFSQENFLKLSHGKKHHVIVKII